MSNAKDVPEANGKLKRTYYDGSARLHTSSW